MTIKTKLSQQDYSRFYMYLFYTKIINMLIVLVGLFNIVIWAMYMGKCFYTQTPPTLNLIIGILLVVVLPFLIYGTSVAHYKGNARLKENLIYEYTPDKIKITGQTFQYESDWSTTLKIVEYKNWFLVHSSAKTASFLPKKCMTTTEIDELRTLFKSIDAVKVKKLKSV